MSKAMLNVYVRTVTRRMTAGEELEDVLAGYPKLTDAEKQLIRDRVEE